MKSWRTMVLGVLMAISIVILAYPQQAPTQGQPPIKVGIINDFTGPQSLAGRPQRNAAVQVINEWNKKGGIQGRKIVYVEDDDRTDASRSRTIAKRFIEAEGVIALFGSSSSTATIPIVTTAEAAGGRICMGAAAASKLFESKWWYSCLGSQPWLVECYLSQALVKDGHKKIAHIYSNHAYGIDGHEVSKKRIAEIYGPKYGAQLVAAEAVEAGATDVTAQVGRIKKAQPDAIFTWVTLRDSVLAFYRAYQELGLAGKVPVYEVGATLSPILKSVGPGLFEGVYIMTYYHPKKPGLKEALASHKAMFGEEPSDLNSWVENYDGVNQVLTCMQRAKDPTNVEELAVLMERVRDVPQLSGRLEDKFIVFGPPSIFAPEDRSLMHLRPFTQVRGGKEVFPE